MRHLSPPQQHIPRDSDPTRNPKAAEAKSQELQIGCGMRLSIPAVARAPPHWQVHAAWLLFSALQMRQGEEAHGSYLHIT